MAKCPRCGIDEESISEHDALDAVRTFPGRYRRAVDGLTPEQFAVVSGGWSVGAYLRHVGEILERTAAALTTVLDDPGVDVAPFPDESAAPAAASADASAALDRIDRAAAALVAAGGDVSGEAWTRPFTLGGVSHEAGWLVRHAAHDGAHHLRDIERITD